MKYNPRDENSIKAVMAKANVVINLIGKFLISSFGSVSVHALGGTFLDIVTIFFSGRDYETRNYSFEEVNHHMAAQLAKVSLHINYILMFLYIFCDVCGCICHLTQYYVIKYADFQGTWWNNAIYTPFLFGRI